MPLPALRRLPGPSMRPLQVSSVPPAVLTVLVPLSSSINRETVKSPVVLSVPPPRTTALPAPPRLPSDDISSVPADTRQLVVVEVEPVRVQVLVPVFSNWPKSRYCKPILLTLKLPAVVPPSRKVSADPACTTPVMIEVERSSSTLVPPVKVMALAGRPSEPAPLVPRAMVPLLTMVRPSPTTPTPP